MNWDFFTADQLLHLGEMAAAVVGATSIGAAALNYIAARSERITSALQMTINFVNYIALNDKEDRA